MKIGNPIFTKGRSLSGAGAKSNKKGAAGVSPQLQMGVAAYMSSRARDCVKSNKDVIPSGARDLLFRVASTIFAYETEKV